MSRLLSAELARVRARPVVWAAVALAALGSFGIVVLGWWDSRPPSPAQVAAAEEQHDRALADWREYSPGCVAGPADADAAAAGVPGPCDPPVLERFLPPRSPLGDVLRDRMPTAGLVVVLAGLVVGSGLVTADFASGAMGTWLTFEPRRGRVLLSRLVAASVAIVPVALVTALVTCGGLLSAHLLNGAPVEVTPSAAGALVGTAARWCLAALAATTVGTGLAFAVRHGAAVTGLAVWWVAAVESTLPLLVPAARWLPLSTNLRAWTDGWATYVVPRCLPDPATATGESCTYVEHVVRADQAALVGGVLALVCLLAGWWSFRLRDVA